jgi:ABC-type molybdenum transport system ATPase subunit/photorepair protein PhrA
MKSPVNVWALRKRLGLVSDELQSRYGDAVTVHQCVATGLFASIGRVPLLDRPQVRSVDEWLAKLKLDALRATSVHDLSYGQFRRVLIARAMVQRPDVLLLDEPTSGMDRESTMLVWSQLLQLVHQGTSIVMASHEADVASGLFTHQLTLQDGCASQRALC